MQSRPVTQIALKVNGSERTVEVDPNTPLLFVLNDELVCADRG
jgi:aerobic-type carbon monoxide dehydrogenase small subunit (CoxS/CutS family)